MRITKHPANLIIRKTQQTSYNHKHTFSGRRIIVSIKRSPRKEWWPVSKRMPCVWYSDFDSQESNSSVTKQLRRGYETEPKSSQREIACFYFGRKYNCICKDRQQKQKRQERERITEGERQRVFNESQTPKMSSTDDLRWTAKPRTS